MPETFPRWNMPAVDFVETDTAAIEAEIIAGYEQAAGRTLAAGDPVRLFLLSMAAAIVELRGQVNAAAQQNLVTYAQGEFLDALGAYFGVSRLPAAAAAATLEFTLSRALAQSYLIPAGTEATNGIVTFATDEDLVIPAGSTSGSAAATCAEAGAAGNGYEAGSISTLVQALPYVASVRNTAETAGGSDEEEDPALAERIRLAPNAFSCAGPEKAYVFHAKSVNSSIIDVSVHSPTPGVVNVYVLAEGGVPAETELLEEVQERLSAEDVRPLTDDVHALAPEAVSYAIRLDWSVSRADASIAGEIQAAVNAAVQEYQEWQCAKIGRDIAPEKLIHLVMKAGAGHIRLTDPQTSASTFAPYYRALTASQVAQCSGVTVNYLGVLDE